MGISSAIFESDAKEVIRAVKDVSGVVQHILRSFNFEADFVANAILKNCVAQIGCVIPLDS
ncbi:conserved hypothetical protein [Ricinus communis]|uniref:Uncharacterized protein n=1 Tax=Ricinus communis TaxID=3988 RepID=B9RF77_RICCO|nr:conserved hypothetical protein [Ricinus communis]